MDPAASARSASAVALGVAVLLAGALVYTSFGAATEARSRPSCSASANPGKSYELTGKVAAGSVRRSDDLLLFRVRDRNGNASVPVRYSGAVPDPFREGREVIVTGKHEERQSSSPSATASSRNAPRSSPRRRRAPSPRPGGLIGG